MIALYFIAGCIIASLVFYFLHRGNKTKNKIIKPLKMSSEKVIQLKISGYTPLIILEKWKKVLLMSRNLKKIMLCNEHSKIYNNRITRNYYLFCRDNLKNMQLKRF